MNKILPAALLLIGALALIIGFTNALERLFIANICLLFAAPHVYAMAMRLFRAGGSK